MKTQTLLQNVMLSSTIIGSCWSINTNAQSIIEKSYPVSEKVDNGNFVGMITDKDKETIEAIYNYSTGFFGKGLNAESYVFNKDADLVKTETKEVLIESLFGKKFRGESYSYTTVELAGYSVAFNKKQVTMKWSGYNGCYVKSVKTLEKITPKAGNDKGYTVGEVYDVPANKSILVLGRKPQGKLPNGKKDWVSVNYDVLCCDVDGNVTIADTLNLPEQVVIYKGSLKDDNESDNDELARDWIIITAPWNQVSKPKPTDFRFVRISPKGKVLENFIFSSVANYWNIAGAYEKNGSVYLYGAGKVKDLEKKYWSDVNPKNVQDGNTPDYTHIQVCKLTKGKVDFISCPTVQEIQAKAAKPANQKKMIEFDGEALIVNELSVANSGDVFFTCQDFAKKDYKCNYLIQFDAKGTLKKYTGVELKVFDDDNGAKPGQDFRDVTNLGTDERKPITNYFFPSADGKSTYWFTRSVKKVLTGYNNADGSIGYQKLGGSDLRSATNFPHFGIDYCSINNETGEVSELKTLGGQDKKNPYYLMPVQKAYQRIGNYIYFVSQTLETKKAKLVTKNIMLSKIDLTK
ncbi:MAG: hypothetical protein IT239_04180 [Bacteroidia bacterium]|nr:hypothetical protein [Bacteroidia bacterium]